MKKGKASLIKKIAIFIICIFAIFAVRKIYVYATEDYTSIVCNDSVLYNQLKSKISSTYIHSSDSSTYTINVITDYLPEITSLNLSGSSSSKIKDLTGIDGLTYLENLNLSNNSISDVSTLASLTSLTELNLSSNSITSISSLSTLTSLTTLNVASNKLSDISVVSNMSKLKTLNVSSNSLSSVSAVLSLGSLNTLNVSANSSLTDISDVLNSSITDLNLSGTGITSLDGLQDTCTNLTSLDISSCSSLSTLSYLFETEKVNNTTVAKLRNIEVLKIGYTTRSGFSFSSLQYYTSLRELYAQGLPDTSGYYISNVSGIEKISTLEYVNLDDNKISSISYFYVESSNTEYNLTATEIHLANNLIEDASVFSYLSGITYLDLSGNKISDISALEGFNFSYLNLKNQSITMNVYKSSNDTNQYIILCNILQSTMNSSSVAYYEGTTFTTTNVTMNSASTYQKVGYYNVIIDPTTTDTMSITVNGGVASGTTVTFSLSTSTSAINSLMFNDYHLDEALYDYLVDNMSSTSSYIARAPYLINITQKEIANTTVLDLSSHEIEDLTGLSNFSNLKKLYLSDNNISDDSEIAYLTNLTDLYFSNNKLNGSYSSIVNLTKLATLDLSGNEIKDLGSLDDFITYFTDNKKTCYLDELILSNNEISDLSVLGKFSTLKTLDVSGNNIDDITSISSNGSLSYIDISSNNIEDISILANLTSLNTIYMSNNFVKDIESLKNLSLTVLDISGNKISDISILSSQGGLTDLCVDDNMVSDVSDLEGLSLKSSFTIYRQKLTHTLSSNETGTIKVDLPEIFQSAIDSSSNRVYTSSDVSKAFNLENCEVSSDGTYITVDLDSLETNEVASIEIAGGNAEGTTFTVAEGLTSTITYSTTEKTKDNVTATITFNRDASILNNNGSNKYVFTENGEFTFMFEDEDGFGGEATATVDWIDNVAPEVTVTYSTEDMINGDVTVTVTSSEEIANSISSWDYIDTTKTSITKTYTENAEETISIEDEVGNSTSVKIKVNNIDRDAPVITGVEDGKEYDEAITPVVTDENIDTVILTRDGNTVSNWTSGKKITTKGTYVLTATDKAGNSTTVTFTLTVDIEVDDKITSEKYTVDDTNLYITDTTVGTTVEEFKENINTEVDYTITDGAGNAMSDSDAMATGYKLATETDKEYIIAVKGDVNGDGKLDISDVSIVASHVVDKYTIEGIYAKAADVVSNSAIDISDLSKLASALVGNATL